MSLDLSWERWAIPYLLVLARSGGVVGFSPVLGSQPIPMRVKAALAAGLALLLTPLGGSRLQGTVSHPAALVVALAGELVVGAVLGLAVRMTFSAVTMAGELAAIQMGIGLPAALDPYSQSRLTAVGSLLDHVAVVIFLAVGGHHALLTALAQSLTLAPPLTVALPGSVVGYLVGVGQAALELGLRLAAPVGAAMLAAMTVLGLLNRVAPQVNVFMVSFALTIGVGLLALLAALPFIVGVMEGALTQLPGTLAALLGRLAHGD